MSRIFATLALFMTSTLVWSQIKVSTIADESDPASKAVMTDLRSKFSAAPQTVHVGEQQRF